MESVTQEKYPRLRIPADDGSDKPIGWLGLLVALVVFGCFAWAVVSAVF